MPLLYVSHDKVYELSQDGKTEISNISTLPKEYQKAVKKVQKKLNE
jgi:DNA-binding ferritin-like protein (Dps family)